MKMVAAKNQRYEPGAHLYCDYIVGAGASKAVRIGDLQDLPVELNEKLTSKAWGSKTAN